MAEKKTEIVEVMSAEQAGRFLDPGSGRMIVTFVGARAAVLVNDPYYKALPVYSYAADPDHKEALLRRITRKLMGRQVTGNKCLERNEEVIPAKAAEATEAAVEESATLDNVIPFTPKQRTSL